MNFYVLRYLALVSKEKKSWFCDTLLWWSKENKVNSASGYKSRIFNHDFHKFMQSMFIMIRVSLKNQKNLIAWNSTATTKLDHISHEHPLVLLEDFDASSIADNLFAKHAKFQSLDSVMHTHVLLVMFSCTKDVQNHQNISNTLCTHNTSLSSIGTNYNHKVRPSDTSLLPLQTYFSCAGCTRKINLNMWVYSCEICHMVIKLPYNHVTCYRFVLCVRCAVLEPVFSHQGHQQHSLTLLCRRGYFRCDACGIELGTFLPIHVLHVSTGSTAVALLPLAPSNSELMRTTLCSSSILFQKCIVGSSDIAPSADGKSM